MKEAQVVVFSLNGEVCGVETSQVKEIVKYTDVSPVDGSPGYSSGVINLRGKKIPLVDLNNKFHLGATTITKKSKVIISESMGPLMGYVVNDVSEIARFTQENLEDAPEILARTGNRYLRGVAKRGEKIIEILDLERIVAPQELEALQKMVEEPVEA